MNFKERQTENREKQAELQKIAQQKEKHFREALNRTVNNIDGAYVVHRIMEMCNFTLPSVPQKDGNPYFTAYNEGRRSLYLELRTRMNRDSLKIIEINEGEIKDG